MSSAALATTMDSRSGMTVRKVSSRLPSTPMAAPRAQSRRWRCAGCSRATVQVANANTRQARPEISASVRMSKVIGAPPAPRLRGAVRR